MRKLLWLILYVWAKYAFAANKKTIVAGICFISILFCHQKQIHNQINFPTNKSSFNKWIYFSHIKIDFRNNFVPVIVGFDIIVVWTSGADDSGDVITLIGGLVILIGWLVVFVSTDNEG